MEPFPVSIVIPTLNEERYLPELLISLRAIKRPLDVIVVDGKSEDSTAMVVELHRPYFNSPSSLRLIVSQARNISWQRNLGAIHAKHEVIVFCDADVVIKNSERFNSLIDRFQREEHVIAAPRLVPTEKGKRLFLLSTAAFLTEIMLSIYGKHYFPGALLITRKNVFEKVKGFNPSILLAEDIDYCKRASQYGSGKLYSLPVHVSARRYIKYGYGWIFKEWRNILLLIRTGEVAQDLDYPFGVFNER